MIFQYHGTTVSFASSSYDLDLENKSDNYEKLNRSSFIKCFGDIIADFIKHMNFFDLGKIAKDKNMI